MHVFQSIRGRECCNRLPVPPTPAPLLQQQGVSVLTVLTACNRNYVNMQGDQAAYVLFNSTLFNGVVQGFTAPMIATASCRPTYGPLSQQTLSESRGVHARFACLVAPG